MFWYGNSPGPSTLYDGRPENDTSQMGRDIGFVWFGLNWFGLPLRIPG